MKTKKHKLPRPDSRGRIRPVVGQLASGIRARFQVGDKDTAPSEADRRLDLIRLLYERQCARSNIDFWNEWTRQVVLRIGRGQPVTDLSVGHPDNPEHMVGCVEQLKAWGIPVQVTEHEAYQRGLALHNADIQAVVQQLVSSELKKQTAFRGAVAERATLPGDPMTMASDATLHDAIDAYSKHRRATGKKDQDGNLTKHVEKHLDYLRYMKNAHEWYRR